MTAYGALVDALRKVVAKKQWKWKIHDSVIQSGRRVYLVGCSCGHCVERAGEIIASLRLQKEETGAESTPVGNAAPV